MKALSLLGIHTDSEHLVLVNEEGERYLLPINEELRSIVRQHRRKLAAALETTPAGAIRPKEIQTMIRGGATAEEVATAAGIELEHVKRYELPVLSERAWVAQQARQTRVAPDSDAPNLGDLVIDRLAARGVSPASLRWDATRQPGEEWIIHLEFIQDAKSFEANWEFDMDNRVISALDEQSRWLTETATPSGSPSLLRKSFFAGTDIVTNPPSGNTPSPDRVAPPDSATANLPETFPELSETEALLNELNAARGTRLTVVAEAEDDDVSAMEAAIASGFQESDSSPVFPESTADSERNITEFKPRVSQQVDAGSSPSAAKKEAGVLPGMETIAPEPNPGPPKRARHPGRAPMPSWDEILFGSKSE